MQGRWVGRDQILRSLVILWTTESSTNFLELVLLSYGASVRAGQGDQVVETVISEVRDGELWKVGFKRGHSAGRIDERNIRKAASTPPTTCYCG